MHWLKKYADYNDSSFKILKMLNWHQLTHKVMVYYTNIWKVLELSFMVKL
jgi:hypothetical protein